MSDIVIYKDGSLKLKATIETESIWLNQKQLCDLFERDKSVISRHIRNIYQENELDKKATVAKNATVQKEGSREVTREVDYYNLDLIISLGYRVNSQKATQFRKWATNILKEYIIKGYVLNKERLQIQKLQELEQTIALIKQGLNNQELSATQAKGFTELVSNYAKSWALLQGYDEQTLKNVVEHTEQKFVLSYNEALEAIAELKNALIKKGEATELFGQEKAANLLYYVIKGHPFNDGNKRIGAYLFVLFLHKNGILHKANGETKISDNALASLALLVATSAPEQKDIIIKLVINMLYEGEL